MQTKKRRAPAWLGGKREIPLWVGLVFCVLMLILEVLTGREEFLILFNAGLVFIIGYHIGNTGARLENMDARVSTVEGDVREIRKEIEGINARIGETNTRISRIEEDVREIRKDIKDLLKKPKSF